MTDMGKIEAGYRAFSDVYDASLTSRGIWRFYNNIIWGIDDCDYVDKALSGIPSGFSGKLLDVPVGTGVHTFQKYARLRNARITALDYSKDMLAKAKQRMSRCEHISFVQGDAGALLFNAESFDLVFSMNGFHAFPDKPKAFDETKRVLKKGGVFCGCFYVKGERRLTDLAIRAVYVQKGWFTPPFYTLKGLQNKLEGMYREVLLEHVKSIACFRCVK